MPTPTVLFVPGSLRAGAFTTQVLRMAATQLPDGVDAVELDVVRALPYYDQDLDGDEPPAAVVDVRRAVSAADAVVISTPEYNGTIPGGLHNAVDWLSRPYSGHALAGKPVLVLGASPNSQGALAAVDWLRALLGALGAEVLGEPVAIAKVRDRLADESELAGLVDELRAPVEALLDAVVTAA